MTIAILIAGVAYLALILVIGSVLKSCDREMSDLDELKRRNEKQ